MIEMIERNLKWFETAFSDLSPEQKIGAAMSDAEYGIVKRLREKYDIPIEVVRDMAIERYDRNIKKTGFNHAFYALELARVYGMSEERKHEAAKASFRSGLEGVNYKEFTHLIDRYNLSDQEVEDCVRDAIDTRIPNGNYEHAFRLSMDFNVPIV